MSSILELSVEFSQLFNWSGTVIIDEETESQEFNLPKIIKVIYKLWS